MFGIGTTELLIVLGICVLLFGSSRVPRLARDLGRSVVELRKGFTDDVESLESHRDS